MNILVLYQSPWANAAANYCSKLVTSLLSNNHNVTFVGRTDSPASNAIKEKSVVKKNLNLLVRSPFKFFTNINKVKKIIKENNIDVVIPITAQGHIITGILNKINYKRIPIIKICLDNVPPVNNFLNKYLHNNLTDYFIFPGLATKSRYDKIFKIRKYKILHAPLDLESFLRYNPVENLKEKLKISSDKIVVSFIGRFAPEKGIFFLLEIIKKVIQESQNIYFILSGEEGEIKFTEVQKKLVELNAQHYVKVIPRLDDVRDLINISDIGILSSRYSEYICRIAMEFMTFGIPVVVPNLNVIPEVVENNETGFIYDLEDSQMAADNILLLSENLELRDKMCINSKNRIKQNYSIQVFSKEIEEIIKIVNAN